MRKSSNDVRHIRLKFPIQVTSHPKCASSVSMRPWLYLAPSNIERSRHKYKHGGRQCFDFQLEKRPRSIDKSESEGRGLICTPIQEPLLPPRVQLQLQTSPQIGPHFCQTSGRSVALVALRSERKPSHISPTCWIACMNPAKSSKHSKVTTSRRGTVWAEEASRRLGAMRQAMPENFAELPCADSRAPASGRRSQGTAECRLRFITFQLHM